MTPQLTTIEVTPAAAQMIQALQERAAAQGETIETLLRPLVEDEQAKMPDTPAPPTEPRPFYETATPEEWVKAFRAWADSLDYDAPGLTIEDVSRETIYEDR